MRTSDVIVIGAGIIGLAHAYAAATRGLRVTVIEENAGTLGASIRNFGHCCITGQSDRFATLAEAGREHWLAAASAAGFWAAETGGYVLAQTEAELAVLTEAQQEKGTERIELLDGPAIHAAIGAGERPSTAIGGARLALDLRVDPREAAPRLAAWLAERGVEFLYSTRVLTAAAGVVRTTRGTLRAAHVIACTGHHLKGLFPELAATAQVRECALAMSLVKAPAHFDTAAAMLSGTSLLRYDAFSRTAAAEAVRAELAARTPELIEMGANVMFTRRPDGTLLVGDSHHYAETVEPFVDEAVSSRLLAEAARLLGVDQLRVIQRWQGVYASSATRPLVVEAIDEQTTAVTVATGIGMTIAFGLAEDTLAGLSVGASAAA